MTEPRGPDHEARVSALLSDAVSDVEPRDALDSIRNRTKVTPMSARRPWIYAAGGAVVATAAMIGAIAYAGDTLGLTSADEPGPAGHHRQAKPSRAGDGSDGPAPSEPTTPAEPATQGFSVAAYYVGETPRGSRLYREFDKIDATDPLAAGLAALQQDAADPDYSTPWPAGAFSGTSFDGTGADGVIQVALADASLHGRPAGMTRPDAELAIQQVVYTLQAAVQARAAVQFVLDGNPIDQVYGVPTSEPLTNAPVNDVLAQVSITSPEEGATVSGSFTASGVANSFEANVPWQLRQGDRVVKSGFSSAEGWMDRLYPWQSKRIDVSGLPAGEYTFVATTDDPSGGAEGSGPDVDTRTITIR
jgi:immunoglobulin-like protein involved in spore germination/sporulation and spore germination protein